MREADWTSLVYAVERGTCTLMLGPDAMVGTLDGERLPESLGMSTIIEATSAVAASLRATVRTMRDRVNAATDIRRAELVIDGRAVPVGQLTDAEIDDLFPE